METQRNILYCIAAGILLSLAWSGWFTGLVLFFGFVPLLLAEHHFFVYRDRNKPRKVFLYATLAFLLWNAISVCWIRNATIIGAITAVLLGSFLMSTAFWLFHVTHRCLGHRRGYAGLIFYWLAFEHLYLNAAVSFPWLNLGNGLAKEIWFIQWYEYTGAQGGSLWILLVNVAVFIMVRDFPESKTGGKTRVTLTALLIFIPMALSLLLFITYREKPDPRTVVILQPNIDPYAEATSRMTNEEQLTVMLQLADSLANPGTDYFVGPEAAINDNIWLNHIHQNRSIKKIRKFMENHPGAGFVTGAITMLKYGPGEEIPSSARKFTAQEAWYDVYNSTVQVDTTQVVQLYHKSKLVAGVEKMPLPRLLKPLKPFIVRLGGTTSGYGIQKERTTLDDYSGTTRVGTAICYESVYGEYFTGWTREGANLMFVVTNDGWWGNTAGYRQHLTYSGIRAIENRRSIARAANTGISCVINQKGEILQQTGWGEKDAIRSVVHVNNKITFYARYGDYIGRISCFLTAILLTWTLVKILMKKKE